MKTRITLGLLAAVGLSMAGLGAVSVADRAQAAENVPGMICESRPREYAAPLFCKCPGRSVPGPASPGHMWCTYPSGGGWGSWGPVIRINTVVGIRLSDDRKFVGVHLDGERGPLKVSLDDAQITQLVSMLQREQRAMRQNARSQRPPN